MDIAGLEAVIAAGENEHVEFKRCGHQPGSDVFESICSFANGFGGQIFLGIEDDGTIRGIDPDEALPIMRNVQNVINNPNAFDVPIAIEFERIEADGRQILKMDVPNSPQVHSFKGKVYLRKGDSDVVIRGSVPLAELCIRKQSIYTEQRIFEHVTIDDLRADLIEEARKLAQAKRKDHPWRKMTNEELLESVGFRGKNYSTGETGYTLAAVVTLGRDEVIRSVCPAYKTDAIVRSEGSDRYDDRLTTSTNLMEAYDLLSGFGRKHLPDRFFLVSDRVVSLRDVIIRELIVNCLIHREFTSPFPAKVLIDGVGIRTENASRASFEGPLEPNAFAPLPKNPNIASFFSHIGLAEELGSGTREIFRCSQLYTGRDPELEEGVVFKAFVPVQPSDEPSGAAPGASSIEYAVATARGSHSSSAVREAALALAARPEGLRTRDLVEAGHSKRTAQRIVGDLLKEGSLVARGNGPSRSYALS